MVPGTPEPLPRVDDVDVVAFDGEPLFIVTLERLCITTCSFLLISTWPAHRS